MSSDLLKNLSRQAPDASSSSPKSQGRLLSLGIPLAIVVGFALVLALLFGDRLLPAQKVVVETVVTLPDDPDAPVSEPAGRDGEGDPFDAPVLFQASGWFEPDPLPTKVSALIPGVIDEVFVLEGERVEQGELLATLIDDDERLNLATARANLEMEQAQLDGVLAAIDVNRAEAETLRSRITSAQAMLKYRQLAQDRFEGAGSDATAAVEIDEARQLALAQEANVAALEAELAGVNTRRQQLEADRARLKAEISRAETEVARRELALSRTRIASPISGRVMRLLVTPGQQRALGAENKDSAAVAYLYNPEKIQARIDVPLAEAAQLRRGQAVLLRTNFLPDDVFRGRVERIVGEADLQRNTLQAKVVLLEPNERLRPDMLCRAEFLAGTSSAATSDLGPAAPAQARVFVPEAALVGQSDRTAEVWVLDERNERVQRKEITLGREKRENYRRVAEGLKPGDRVVLNPPEGLQAGERVSPQTES